MKLSWTLTVGSLTLIFCCCDEPASNAKEPDWPLASDGFRWPATEGEALVFDTVANAEVDDDVKMAAETLDSRYSPDSVTFAHVDLDADGLTEILMKSHHYGFAPSYAILTPNDSGDYSTVGSATGDQIFRCEGVDGWQQLEGRAANGQIRWLFSYRDGLYDLRRSEQLDVATNTVTILFPTKAEQGGAGQPATRSESK